MAASHLSFLKSTLVFSFLLLNMIMKAQPSLKVDTIYLNGTPVSKVRSSYNGEVWFLDKNASPQIYRINREGQLKNRSSDFVVQLQSAITDFVCVDTNEIIIGTDSNFTFYYKHGAFYQIGTNNGLLANENHVNSLFLKHNLLKQYGDTVFYEMVFGISTNVKAYWSDAIIDEYTDLDGTYYRYDNKKFLSKNDPFVLNIPRAEASHPSYCNLGGGIREFGDFSFTDYGNLNCSNIVEWTNGSYIFAWLGFDKGYVIKAFYTNELYRYLTSQKIHAIVDFSDNYALIAADSGLYYSNSHNDPHKIDLGIGNFTAYDVEVWQGTVYVASSIGLLKLINTNCAEYHLVFDQDKQYVDTEISEAVKFEPVLSADSKMYSWDFGDASTSFSKFPSHIYSSPGNYKVQLIASNGFCSDTAYGFVTAYVGSEVSESAYDQYFSITGSNYANTSEMLNIADLDGDLQADLLFPQNAILKLTNKDTLVVGPVEWNPEVIPEGEYFNTWIVNCLVGDFNNDGLNDIVAGTRIFINRGDFNFQVMQYDASEPEFLQFPAHCLLDFDNDGKLDIALGYNSKLAVYLNRGSFTFEKVWLNLPEYAGSISGIKWFDIDNDDDNDLIVSGISKNNFFINNNGHYNPQEFAELSGISIDYIFPVDLNNDRNLDLYFRSGNRNYLFLGNADTPILNEKTWLTNERNLYQYNGQSAAMGVTYADFDNNGHIDFFKNALDNSKSSLFMNYGNMIFKNDEHNPFSTDLCDYVKTIASADISDDGKVDILFDHTDYFTKEDYIFLNNTPSDHNWIKFHLYGSMSNLNAIGTKVFIKTQNGGVKSWQYRFIESVHSDHAQNGYEVHFGLGDADVVDTLEILWPSGERNYYTNLVADSTYYIVEPLIGYHGDTLICENENTVFQMPVAKSVTYEWLLNNNPVGQGTSKLRVDQPGVYQCIIHYPSFTDTTNAVRIYHKEVTPSIIMFENDSIFCPEDSIRIISASHPGASYSWMINGMRDTAKTQYYLYVTDTTSVQQMLTNSLNCSDTSNVLVPRHFPSPQIHFNLPVDFCEGDSTEVIIDPILSSYLWSNGDTTHSTMVYENDTLSVTVWNEYGCISVDTVHQIVWPLPYVNLGEDVVIEYNETHYSYNCSSEPYLFSWNDSSNLCFRGFSGLELNIGKHDFMLEVTSEHGCVNNDTLLIEVVLSKENAGLNQENLVVFPNPSNGEFNIYLNGKLLGRNTCIEIINMDGDLVAMECYEVLVPLIVTFQVPYLSSQSYIIRVTNNGYQENDRLLIIK